jgi:hypothetical protein
MKFLIVLLTLIPLLSLGQKTDNKHFKMYISNLRNDSIKFQQNLTIDSLNKVLYGKIESCYLYIGSVLMGNEDLKNNFACNSRVNEYINNHDIESWCNKCIVGKLTKDELLILLNKKIENCLLIIKEYKNNDKK